MFSLQTIEKLGYQIKFCFMTLLFMLPAWWIPNLIMMMTTKFDDEAGIAAQIILRSFNMILAIIPFAFSTSSGFFIGRKIGEGKIEAIKKYFNVSINTSFVMGGTMALIHFCC